VKKSAWKKIVLAVVFVLLAAMLAAGCAAPAAPEPEPAPPDENGEEGLYRDGTFEAVSQGNERGYVQVSLTLENDEIVAADIIEFDGVGVEKVYEDYGQRFPLLEEAHQTLENNMIEEDTWDVDVVSGATSTSEKTREAARFALERASVEAIDMEYFDGTFMAISDATERGWGIAWVTLENDEIIGIKLEGTTPAQEDGEDVFDAVGRQVFALKGEEYPWEPYHEAKEVIAEDIVASQSPDVDTYTEATGASNQWMQAVERALEAARSR